MDSVEIEYSLDQGGYKGGLFCVELDNHQFHHKAIIQSKIDINRKVFPDNEVIGWYRVSKDVYRGPTKEYFFINNF